MLVFVFLSVLIAQGQDCADENCEKCPNRACTKCMDGYYLYTQIGYPPSCIYCQPFCSTCTPDDSCTACEEGYLFYNGYCIECPSTCLDCTGGVCSGCTENSNPYEEFCCDEGIVSCTWEEVYECSDGYLFDGATCISCPSTCTGCVSGHCSECAEGSTQYDDYFCCGEGVSACDWNSVTGCKDKYYFTGDSCIDCPEYCSSCLAGNCITEEAPIICNVANCVSCSKDNECTSCTDGYYADGGKCFKCYSTCSTCSSQKTCKSCLSGYTLSSGNCCSAGCLTCTQTACTQCASGYCLTSTGTCTVTYTPPANRCTRYASGSTWCEECSAGYYPYGGVCQPCFNLCTICSAQQVCNDCIAGYDLKSGYCCPPRCRSCSQTTCWLCDSGYRASGLNCVPI